MTTPTQILTITGYVAAWGAPEAVVAERKLLRQRLAREAVDAGLGLVGPLTERTYIQIRNPNREGGYRRAPYGTPEADMIRLTNDDRWTWVLTLDIPAQPLLEDAA